jgi:DNA-directed RNA polymerase alpha subunit
MIMIITKIQNGPGYILKIGEVYIYFDTVHILEWETDNSIILSYDGRSSAMLYEDDSEIFKKLWEKFKLTNSNGIVEDNEKFNLLKLNLRKHAFNGLKENGAVDWQSFKVMDRDRILRMTNFGNKSFFKLQELVIKHNLKCAINP